MSIEKEIRKFLDEICVELGFCLPPQQIEDLASIDVYEVDEFIRAVFIAEGIDPSMNLHLFRQLKKRFTDRFGSKF